MIIQIANGQLLRVLEGQTGETRSLAISANNALVSSGNETGTIKFWNFADGADRLQIHGHDGPVNSLAFPGAAFVIGAIGGVIVVFAVPLLERFRIDDVVGAIPAHLACGIWGTIAVPITNSDASFASQLEGIVAIGVFVSAASAIVWLALKYSIGVRPSESDEWVGLDHTELGLEVYADWGTDPFRKGARKSS